MTTTPRLIVIDDSLTIRKLVELSFRGTAFVLEFATSGGDGIAKAVQGNADVILLDCVLPDMKVAEACQRLAQDPRSAKIPIVLISAKERSALRDIFERYEQVVDFAGKPFSAEEIVSRVNAALSGAPRARREHEPLTPPRSESRHAFGGKEIEAAAKILYARLAQSLALVPEWLRQSATAQTAPASFLARKLLSHESVSGILDALAPLYQQALRPDGANAPEEMADRGAPFQGQISGWPLMDLLGMVAGSRRTGELLLMYETQRIVVFWDNGEIVLCSSHDPVDYLLGGEEELSAVPLAARRRAEAEQRSTGQPIYATLAEAGELPEAIDTAALLHERGFRLLRQLRSAGTQPVRFAWRERSALPPYAITWARHIPLSTVRDLAARSDQTECETEASSVAQLGLERLRRPSTWGEMAAATPRPEQGYERALGFTERLRRLRLTASEQRVLALVDRRNSINAIATQSGIPLPEVTRIMYRLGSVDLIQPVVWLPATSISSSVRIEPPPRPIMVLDPDDDGFCQPLRDILARRPRPIPLLNLAGESDLTRAIARERPSLVLLSETATPAVRLEEIARAVRSAPQLAAIALAAVLETNAPRTVDALAAAGFDAIWARPVHVLDLIALLASQPPFPPKHNPSPSNSRKERDTHAHHTDR